MPLTCEYLRFLPGFLCVDLPTFSVTSKKFLTRLIERCFRARYSLASRALSNASGFCSTNPCTHRFNCTSKGIGAKAPFLFYVAHLIRKRTVLTSFSPCVSQFSNYIAPQNILRAQILLWKPGFFLSGRQLKKCAKNRYFTQIRPRRKKHGTMLDGGGIVQGFSFAIQAEIYIQSAPNNSNEAYTFMGLGRPFWAALKLL